jgi:hypothetical protein
LSMALDVGKVRLEDTATRTLGYRSSSCATQRQLGPRRRTKTRRRGGRRGPAVRRVRRSQRTLPTLLLKPMGCRSSSWSSDGRRFSFMSYAPQEPAILFFRTRRANHRTDLPLAASPIIRRYADDVGASAGGRPYTSNSQPSLPRLTSVRLRASAIGTQASLSAVLRRSFISEAGM